MGADPAQVLQGRWSRVHRSGLALEKAQKRLHDAEDKVERVRHWLHVLPRAVTEYEGPSRQLAGMLDSDLAQGIVLLDHKLEALEAYVALRPPTGPGPAPPRTMPPSPVPAANPSAAPPALEPTEE